MDAEIQPSVRADKWLWAVRIFKTRGDAATACRLNQVTILGQPVKPSRCVRANEILVVEKAPVTRTLRVKEVLEKRMGAKVVESFLEDLTLPEVWEKAREAEAQNRQNRVYVGEEGGRPTKRDRRKIEAFESSEEPSI
ncbi:MAG: ribosome-associated heat shock protein Hsp15 [Verrucomicrobiales bacterium]|jgi:ribosome-associated heat shock protein Hsp15